MHATGCENVRESFEPALPEPEHSCLTQLSRMLQKFADPGPAPALSSF